MKYIVNGNGNGNGNDNDNDNDRDEVLVHVVLTGASGYLGQHLLSHWIENGIPVPRSSAAASVSGRSRITALYHRSEGFPKALEGFLETHSKSAKIRNVEALSVDLTDPSEIESFVASSLAGDSDETQSKQQQQQRRALVVVHAAALSSPRACQENPEIAKAINVPTGFLGAIASSTSASNSLSTIIALSTDQVYDGKQNDGALYGEDEKEGMNPVNIYGRTKLELEDYLVSEQQKSSATSTSSTAEASHNFFALRSSIILGPSAPIDPECAHGTFLDFCKSRGANNEATTFYTNEYRSVVRVDRVLRTIDGIIESFVGVPGAELVQQHPAAVVYNMGGPCRVHRMDMVRAVFDKFGYDPKLLLDAKQTSAMSPLDISMDSSLLFGHGILREEDEPKQQDPTTYLKELVAYVFGQEQ